MPLWVVMVSNAMARVQRDPRCIVQHVYECLKLNHIASSHAILFLSSSTRSIGEIPFHNSFPSRVVSRGRPCCSIVNDDAILPQIQAGGCISLILTNDNHN